MRLMIEKKNYDSRQKRNRNVRFVLSTIHLSYTHNISLKPQIVQYLFISNILSYI